MTTEQNAEKICFPISGNLKIGEKNGCLYEGNDPICNYVPVVTKCWTEESEDGSVADYVSFRLKVDGMLTSEEYSSSFSKLRFLDFSKNAKCKEFVSHKRTMKVFDLAVRSSINGIPVRKVTAYHRLGCTTYHGEPAYLAGNRLLTKTGFVDSDDFRIEGDLQSLSLDVDLALTERNVFDRLIEQMRLQFLAAPVLLAFTFLSLIRSRLVACGIVPGFSLYVTGKSGAGKTMLAHLLTRIYNCQSSRNPCSTDLSSSEASILHEMNFYRDCVFIVDDLHEEEVQASGKHLQDKLGRILRLSGNNRAAEKMAGDHLSSMPPEAMVLSTGEFTLSVESTMARSIHVPMDSGIDFKLADKAEQQPCVLPTCVYCFLRWYLGNAVEIEKDLPEFYHRFRGELYNTSSNPHLADNYAILLLGMYILMKYGESIGQPNCLENMDRFVQKIKNLMKNQNEEIQKLHAKMDEIDLVKDIAELYQAGEFQLSTSGRFRPGLDDGVIKNDVICLVPACLLEMLKSRHPGWAITTKQVGRQLREAGLLHMDVSGRTTEKKTEQGLYMYHIDRRKLVNFFN